MRSGQTPERERFRVMKALGLVVQLGLTVALIMLGTIGGGIYLDRKVGTGWVFTAVLAPLGAGASFYTLYKMAMRTSD